LALAEEAVGRRALDYDRHGDNHYHIISAYIKSLRGGDPDAALYWMARMLEGGEDPMFIARRLVIQSSEDIGNADPRELLVAMAALQAVEKIGLPEAAIPLAQATVYVATAPKSNASYVALHRAQDMVRNKPPASVPMHLRAASLRGARERLGEGVGYIYPHDAPGHFAPQDYLPPGFKNEPFYEPTDLGYEAHIARRLQSWWGTGEEDSEHAPEEQS
jgi:putative ATPase